MRAWMLLLVVVTLGCGEKPAPPVDLRPVPESEAVAEPRPEIGRDAVIAAIEKLGGKVEYDEENPERPIIIVDLDGAEVTDALLVHLKGLTSLRFLLLGDTQVTDTGLRHLKGLPSLRYLDFRNTQVTDAGLEHLKGLTSLHQLNLSRTQITDVGLEHLKGLPSLQLLCLDTTQVTDAGLEHLKGLTSLRGLVLSYTQVTDAGLEHLEGLASLGRLSLNGTQVTDAGLEHLKGLPSLEGLFLNGTQVTDAGVNDLKQALPNCGIFRPNGTPGFGEFHPDPAAHFFKMVDKNGDGKLEGDEISKEDLSRTDTDGDGAISLSEFNAAMMD